jgi:hypothetical protein
VCVVEKVEHWRQCDVIGRALVFRIEVDATCIDYEVGKRRARVSENLAIGVKVKKKKDDVSGNTGS